MEGASRDNQFELLKKMLGAKNWNHFAELIAYSRQRVSQARKADKLSLGMLMAAAHKLNISTEELVERLDQTSNKNVHIYGLGAGLSNNTRHEVVLGEDITILWKEFQSLLNENKILYREKAELLKENGELKTHIARLEERLKSVDGGGTAVAAATEPKTA